MSETMPCFECLQRRFHSDFPQNLEFRYALSDSPLPLAANRAVIRIPLKGEPDSPVSGEIFAEIVLLGTSKNNIFRGDHGSDEVVCDAADDFEEEICSVKEVVCDTVDGFQEEIASVKEGFVTADGGSLPVTSCEQPMFTRVIRKLAPVAYVGRGSDDAVVNLALKYLFGDLEDDVISSINSLLEGKNGGRLGLEFLKFVVFDGMDEYNNTSSVRHPNIIPVLGVLQAQCTYLLLPNLSYSLADILNYSPKVLKTDWQIRFLTYQILSALAHIHSLGISHGNITPASIVLDDSFWMWLSISESDAVKLISCTKASCSGCLENCPSQDIYADTKLLTSVDWSTSFRRWWHGEMSNFEYLLVLNKLAGRRWGDHTFHMVMPWVIDFSVKPNENNDAGWRDLTKSKWRLAKGDEQLDFTYSSSEVPHHVSDECLSELAVCSYKARRLPLTILRSAVRSVYEPNEYPSSMQRLYQWTPDECIPEFYCDPRIFKSLHSNMSDLALPSWSSTPEEFVLLHRDALECDHVSEQIHHWIDLTFGYKLSGQASIEAKNVMLPTSNSALPKSTGRKQLFTKPHPRRRGVTPHFQYHSQKDSCLRCQIEHNDSNRNSTKKLQFGSQERILSAASDLETLEEATLFCEHARHLDPIYSFQDESIGDMLSRKMQQNDEARLNDLNKPCNISSLSSDFSLDSLLDCFQCDNSSTGFQELLYWRQHMSSGKLHSMDHARDIFSFGCLLAELYLGRPLFDPVSFAAYKEGVMPEAVQELPPHVAILVEASIQQEWRRRPSAKCLLESQFFSTALRSVYSFVAPLHLLAKTEHRLKYAAKLAREGALKAMGTFAAEMSVSYCLPLNTSSLSDSATESALFLLTEFIRCLNSRAIKELILPIIQKILQAPECSYLKVSLLQDSFIRDLWKKVGKQAYLEKMHPLIIVNLVNPPSKISANAASVVLVGSSDELGLPITLHQTVLPLINHFGKGLCADGIEALIRIGSVLGENFISRQLLPLLRNVIVSSLDISQRNKREPMYSWTVLTLIDCFSALDALVSIISLEFILKELVQDKTCLHVKVLMQVQLDLSVIQAAASTLTALCQRIGPDLTAVYVVPQLKDLFDELAFSQLPTSGPTSWNIKNSKQKFEDNTCIQSRADLVMLLYPFLATLIGIEKLRKCCSSWFLLEQFLQRCYSWKWDSAAKMLFNGAGGSIQQSQGAKGGLSMMSSRGACEPQQVEPTKYSEASIFRNYEPWFWFPSVDASKDGTDFLWRNGGFKDELPWKIKASILYSARAHPGAVRSIAVCHDECTIFTAGVGPGFKGSVQKWELSRMNCVSGYYGHEEVVNAICTLSMSGRIASSDGTIHVWNGQTGKLITAYAESSTFPFATTKSATEQSNLLSSDTLTGGILSNAFSGSLYTCMHYLESEDKLVAGMGNGSVRFIDVVHDRKLHLWKSDAAENSFSSLVSAICSCGSERLQSERGTVSTTWIAAGLSSGYCRLFDMRCGNVIAHWRAHDGYITKLAAPEDYLLISSSFDKSLRVWDLRRNLDSQSYVIRGHSDGITSFTIWAQNVISVSRNKIALASLSTTTNDMGGQQRVSPQALHSVDKGMKSPSVISSIGILPFSRLFIVGTEDGFLKVCS